MGRVLASMRMSLRFLYSALFFVVVVRTLADNPAASTLQGMVDKINDGSFNNNFFAGGMLTDTGTKEQQAGGCMLDKVDAITNEDGIIKFPNDLQVDLAAC